jgi:hypothetical protein
MGEPINMNKTQFLVLKGRHILTQGNPGKTGSRPGIKNEFKNRPRSKVYSSEFLISDEIDQHFSLVIIRLRSVRKILFAFLFESSRTVRILLHHFPRAAFRFVPPETYPGLLYFGLSGREIATNYARVACNSFQIS